MPREIEVKLKPVHPQKLREKLAALARGPHACELEINRIFDTSDRRLFQADCGLRIRERCHWNPPNKPAAALASAAQPAAAQHVAPHAPIPPLEALLTYKGPRSAGPIKSRVELNTAVPDAAALAEILGHLGYSERIVYEKRRETWIFEACEIALDELPRLGWFVEIEGPDEAAIAAVRGELGLKDTPEVPDTYVALAVQHGVCDARGTHRLEF